MKVMEWGQVITIIFGVAGFMGIFMFLINKRIDTLETALNKRLDTIEKRIDKLEDDIREMRQLLYRALGETSSKK